MRPLEPGPMSQWGIFAMGTSLSFLARMGSGVCCGEEVLPSWCWGGVGWCSGLLLCGEPLWLLTSLFWLCAEEGFSPEPRQYHFICLLACLSQTISELCFMYEDFSVTSLCLFGSQL